MTSWVELALVRHDQSTEVQVRRSSRTSRDRLVIVLASLRDLDPFQFAVGGQPELPFQFPRRLGKLRHPSQRRPDRPQNHDLLMVMLQVATLVAVDVECLGHTVILLTWPLAGQSSFVLMWYYAVELLHKILQKRQAELFVSPVQFGCNGPEALSVLNRGERHKQSLRVIVATLDFP